MSLAEDLVVMLDAAKATGSDAVSVAQLEALLPVVEARLRTRALLEMDSRVDGKGMRAKAAAGFVARLPWCPFGEGRLRNLWMERRDARVAAAALEACRKDAPNRPAGSTDSIPPRE